MLRWTTKRHALVDSKHVAKYAQEIQVDSIGSKQETRRSKAYHENEKHVVLVVVTPPRPPFFHPGYLRG